MTEDASEVVSGAILQENAELTLEDLSRFCVVGRESIVTLVQVGILEPTGNIPARWRFPAEALRRAAQALRIQRDLELELAAVAVVLDLLDEISDLRAALKSGRYNVRSS